MCRNRLQIPSDGFDKSNEFNAYLGFFLSKTMPYCWRWILLEATLFLNVSQNLIVFAITFSVFAVELCFARIRELVVYLMDFIVLKTFASLFVFLPRRVKTLSARAESRLFNLWRFFIMAKLFRTLIAFVESENDLRGVPAVRFALFTFFFSSFIPIFRRFVSS